MGTRTLVVYIIILVALVWFTIMRPGQKEKKKHLELLEKIEMGDKVLTNGGILGTVLFVDNDYIVLAGENETTQLKVLKEAVTVVYKKESSD